MRTFLRRLREDEDGAVTVDWVVLTAGIVGMTLVVVAGLVSAATDPADGVAAWLSAHEVE